MFVVCCCRHQQCQPAHTHGIFSCIMKVRRLLQFIMMTLYHGCCPGCYLVGWKFNMCLHLILLCLWARTWTFLHSSLTLSSGSASLSVHTNKYLCLLFFCLFSGLLDISVLFRILTSLPLISFDAVKGFDLFGGRVCEVNLKKEPADKKAFSIAAGLLTYSKWMCNSNVCTVFCMCCIVRWGNQGFLHWFMSIRVGLIFLNAGLKTISILVEEAWLPMGNVLTYCRSELMIQIWVIQMTMLGSYSLSAESLCVHVKVFNEHSAIAGFPRVHPNVCKV